MRKIDYHAQFVHSVYNLQPKVGESGVAALGATVTYQIPSVVG
jgi:hypothetical protein